MDMRTNKEMHTNKGSTQIRRHTQKNMRKNMEITYYKWAVLQFCIVFFTTVYILHLLPKWSLRVLIVCVIVVEYIVQTTVGVPLCNMCTLQIVKITQCLHELKLQQAFQIQPWIHWKNCRQKVYEKSNVPFGSDWI